MSLLWKTAVDAAETWIDSQGTYPIPDTHERHVVPIEHVRLGDLFRLFHPTGGSYKMAHGDARHDPSHPGNEEPDDSSSIEPTRMFIVPTERGFTPHLPDGSNVSVYRRRS